MNTENRVALTTRQRALAAAIERINAAAEGRDLTMEEIAQSDALAAALAMLTRDINFNTDIAASPAPADLFRRHAMARGPPPSGHESFLRWRAVSAVTGLSRPSIWRAVRAGTFPRPVQILGPHAVGWIESEVQNWVQARIGQRDQQLQRAVPQSPGRPRKVAAATATTPQT